MGWTLSFSCEGAVFDEEEDACVDAKRARGAARRERVRKALAVALDDMTGRRRKH